jgi:hypothetical protein
MEAREGMAGPYVAAAFVCERVLTERDGVPSFIRVAERFNIAQLPPHITLPEGMPQPQKIVQFSLVIIIKSGDLGGGKFNLSLSMTKPNGETSPSQDVPVFFNGGDDNGAMFVSPMAIPNPEEGLHWFDVNFEGGRITRIPFRVMYQSIQFIQ